jgi:hypothetical protein
LPEIARSHGPVVVRRELQTPFGAVLTFKRPSIRYLVAWRVFAFTLLEVLTEGFGERMLSRGVQVWPCCHPICPLKKRVPYFLNFEGIGHGIGIGSK